MPKLQYSKDLAKMAYGESLLLRTIEIQTYNLDFAVYFAALVIFLYSEA